MGEGQTTVSLKTEMPIDARALALRLLDAWNARDLAGFLDLLSDDIEWYDPAMLRPPARGREAVRRFAEAVLTAFPDFRYEVLEPSCVAADGSRCVLHWRISATHLAPLTPPGFAPTGRRFQQEGLDLIDVAGGKVIRILTCFDTIGAAEQLLGLTLRAAPGSWRERVVVWLQRLAAARARRLRGS